MSRIEAFSTGAQGIPHLSAAATDFAGSLGLVRPQRFDNVVVNPAQGRRVAQEYRDAPTMDSAAVPHYRAMAEETKRQFDFMTRPAHRGGLGIDVSVTKDDPYSRVRDMTADLRDNNRLRVLSTKTTGGHPVFSDDENDMFRAVHDTFGHAATGRGFDPHGEEAAFRSHYSMFTPAARPAMATETRGQNSFVNFGGVEGGRLSADTPFEQKVAVLPSSQLITPIGRRAEFHQATQEAMAAHRKAYPNGQ